MVKTKSLIIKGRGKKYYWCLMFKYQVRLLINDVSRDLPVNAVVSIEVTEIEGADRITFVPIKILSVKDGDELYHLAIAQKKAEYWLNLAEADATKGLDHTNAIMNALRISKPLPKLSSRRIALEQLVAKNKIKSIENRLRAQQARIESRLSKKATE